MTQEELPADLVDPLPPLPPPPLYYGATASKYTPVKVKGRLHCTVCVILAHSGYDLHGPPRPAAYRRKGPIAREPALELCYQHKIQYVTRDNEAREKAHLKPLAGGSA